MGIGFRELLVILVIVLLVFGAKKLKTIGSDLGAAGRGGG
jgi:sec-independent protein translocase protein TatA